MMRHDPTLASLLCILVLQFHAVAQPRSSDETVKPEDFAILPWGHTPGEEKVLGDIKNCGFNLAGFVSPDGLDAVAAAGLKCIVSGPNTHVGDDQARLDEAEIAKRVNALVDRVGKHPALFGYYLRDEPSATVYSGLARWAEAYHKADPKAVPYINLFPNYASAAQMGVPTYEEYVESFVQIVKPPFISYDHYALMDDGSLRQGYFQNLEVVRAAALRHKLPFWNIVLSNAHFRYAEPTEAGLRFQVYTTLAYGGRGISYFTYFAPTSGNYRLAPIDQFGHKTPTWDMLRRVNLQIHKLAPTYCTLWSVNVFHLPEVPSGCQGPTSSKYLDEISGGSFVVGEFEGPGQRPYVLVVNKSLRDSTAFSIRFKWPGRIMQVNAYTGATHAWAGENNWLAPGQGMLLFLAK
jgi:hypothetical protein